MSDYWGKKSDALVTQGTDWMSQLFGGGQKNLNLSTDYYGKLLGGNRAAMMEAIAPEVKSLRTQNEFSKRAMSQFMPSGGGRASTLAEAPFNLSGQIMNLLSGARQGAAGQMANIGLNQVSLSNQQLSALLQMLSATRQQDIVKRGQNMALIGSIAELASKTIDWNELFGNK